MCKGLDEFKPHLHYPADVRAAMQRVAQLAEVKTEDLLTICIYSGTLGLLQALVEEYVSTDLVIAVKLLSTYSMMREVSRERQRIISVVMDQLEEGLKLKRLDSF